MSNFDGQRLKGRYILGERFASGGMGGVWLAHDVDVGREVVIKMPHAHQLDGEGLRERFEQEMQSLSALEIPGVVPVLDVGRHEGTPFLVLPYLRGGSLADRYKAPQQESEETVAPRILSPAEVSAWLEPLAEILDLVHEKRVIHRDVKPPNVLFDEHGKLYLADFGIAKALGDEDTGLTLTGQTLGTPRYMAPEASSDEPLGPAYDQYALAVMAYEALSGEIPHAGRHALEILMERRTRPPTPLSTYRPDLPRAYWEVLAQALSKSPHRRYPSCRAFARAFRRRLERLDGRVSRPRESSRGSRGLRVGAFAGSLLAVGVLALGFVKWKDRPTQQRPSVDARASLSGTLDLDHPSLLNARGERGLEFLGINAKTGLEEYRHLQTGVELILIPSGTFDMGSLYSEFDRGTDETQREGVTLSRFLLAKYELSQGQYSSLASQVEGLAIPEFGFEGGDRPAEMVSWLDCAAWFENTAPRLWFPSEAQWEYGCRAGSATPFAFGDLLSSGDEANFNGGQPYGNGPRGRYRQQTTPRGALADNEWGLFDVHGNVSEWCEDWYGEYPRSAARDPRALTDPGAGYRVIRGGSWRDAAKYCRSAARYRNRPDLCYDNLGVRPALKVPRR